MNEITRTTIASADTDFSYDGIPGASNGNLADDGVRTYEWDALNRLKKVYKTPSSPALIGEYTYDAFGRRIRKVVTNGGLSGTIPNGTTDYLYNSRWQCVEERDGSNDPTNQYVWGLYIDELMAQLVFDEFGVNEHFPLQDLLYRTTAVTEQDGNIIEAFDYDAYGNTLIFSSAGTGGDWWADDAVQSLVAVCTKLFTGQQWEAESEGYLCRARYLSVEIGRFASRDPLINELGRPLMELLPTLIESSLKESQFVYTNIRHELGNDNYVSTFGDLNAASLAVRTEGTEEPSIARLIQSWKLSILNPFELSMSAVTRYTDPFGKICGPCSCFAGIFAPVPLIPCIINNFRAITHCTGTCTRGRLCSCTPCKNISSWKCVKPTPAAGTWVRMGSAQTCP